MLGARTKIRTKIAEIMETALRCDAQCKKPKEHLGLRALSKGFTEFRNADVRPSQHARPSPTPLFAPALQVPWPVRSASRTACVNGWWTIRETRWETSHRIALGQ